MYLITSKSTFNDFSLSDLERERRLPRILGAVTQVKRSYSLRQSMRNFNNSSLVWFTCLDTGKRKSKKKKSQITSRTFWPDRRFYRSRCSERWHFDRRRVSGRCRLSTIPSPHPLLWLGKLACTLAEHCYFLSSLGLGSVLSSLNSEWSLWVGGCAHEWAFDELQQIMHVLITLKGDICPSPYATIKKKG